MLDFNKVSKRDRSHNVNLTNHLKELAISQFNYSIYPHTTCQYFTFYSHHCISSLFVFYHYAVYSGNVTPLQWSTEK